MEKTNKKIRTKYILVGLGLQAFALIFAYLCLTYILFIGWLPAFTIGPLIFIVGIIFIFFSRIKLLYRFILGFWILLVPVWINAEYYYQRQFIQQEIYLIPENYRGWVIVDFSQPEGSAPSLENKAIVLKINSNGVLKTTYTEKRFRDDIERGKDDFREYFFIDNSGNRKKLEISKRDFTNDEIQIFPAVYYFNDDGKTVSKREFFVGTQSEYDKSEIPK